jgi:hypothetical protein
MQERVDRITVALSRGDVTLTWDSRQALMARLQHVQSSSCIRATFDAVGATSAVELNPAQRATLIGVLGEWSLGRGADKAMPEGLIELRDALSDDLADLA